MRIALGSDERTPTTDAVIEELRRRGFDPTGVASIDRVRRLESRDGTR